MPGDIPLHHEVTSQRRNMGHQRLVVRQFCDRHDPMIELLFENVKHVFDLMV